ncbi:hypothetical protein F4778DRAFT_98486 [Xylariomycetidae sp. FL2044]|nr:hypothetical protein F4778DRAFT_98486 [Xylariomycetidae sp. FL2044]
MNLVVDVFIIILPIPMLFHLRLSLPKRFAFAGIFSLGATIYVPSLLRFLWLHGWDLTDLEYGVGPETICSGLEPTLGIVNACLRTINPALAKLTGFNITGRVKSNFNYRESSALYSSQSRNTPRTRRENQAQGFERLEDIPLTNIQADSRVVRDYGEDDYTIQVTTEWTSLQAFQRY